MWNYSGIAATVAFFEFPFLFHVLFVRIAVSSVRGAELVPFPEVGECNICQEDAKQEMSDEDMGYWKNSDNPMEPKQLKVASEWNAA